MFEFECLNCKEILSADTKASLKKNMGFHNRNCQGGEKS